MSHIPYGYEVKDGKIFIVEEAADKARQIFQNYVSGMSLTESAKTAGQDRKSTRLNSSHTQKSRMPSSA